MSQFYKIQFGLSGSVQQAALVDALKEKGGSTIQLSDGVALRIALTLEELKKYLMDKEFQRGLRVSVITAADADSAKIPKDLQAFLRS